jgi:predicted secreted protein
MRDVEPINLTDGQTLLVVVKDGSVAEYTWDGVSI